MSRKGLKVWAISFMAGALVLFSGAGTALSADVCGMISSDTTWDLAGSPYIVTCGIIVQEGVTLTIKPGVAVRFDGPYPIRVDGELIARGTESNMITFTSNQEVPTPGYWAHVNLTDSSVDAAYDGNGNYVSGSILEYCRIEYAGFADKGGVWIDNSGPFINHCTITDCSGDYGGIYADYADNLKITNNTIIDNSASRDGGGIYCSGWSGTVVTISGNTISDNSVSGRGGAIYSFLSDPDISDNILENNTAETGGGIYISYGSPVINNNCLLNPGGYEIYNNGADDVDVIDNWWGTAVEPEIQEKIYDWWDNPSKGMVDYTPWLEASCEETFPVAVSGGPYSGKIGDVISFDGSGSSDPDGSIVSWEWDFGDGNTANGETATNAYDSPGSYTVTLTVTDNGGLSDVETTTAEITCTDADDDGYYAQEGCDGRVDCDDSDAGIYPGAGESWDELDNDCDGVTDEGRYSPLDVNRDGSVTPADALCVFRYYLGLPSCVD